MTATNTANRVNDVGRLFILWLAAHEQPSPNPEGFLADGPTLNGEEITAAELERAVVRAADVHGLVKGIKGNGRAMPARARLTATGQQCVDDFGGDMRRWDEAQRGGGAVTYDHSVHVHARDHVQVAAYVQEAVQNMTVGSVDSDRLRDVGTAAQEIAEVLPRPIQEDVVQAGKDLVRAADTPDDVEQAKTAGQKLLDLLTGSASSLVVVRFVLDALGVALGG